MPDCVDCGFAAKNGAGLAAHRRARHQAVRAPGQEGVLAATERAIAAAGHLTDSDAGALEALRVLARKIDTEARLRELALRWAEEHGEKPPHVDNVSIPTYLKYCVSLGLTPEGRSKLTSTKKEPQVRGKLSVLQGQARSRKAG